MGLVDDIKSQAKKAGTNKGKFLYFKAGVKVRIRFLDDMEDGHKVKFHDSFAQGINVPCQEEFDRECPYCNDDDLRTRDQYAWSVWDYESKEVKILMAPVNQCSPVTALVSLYEAYGTICDRDFVITKSGSQQSTTYSVVPMDKAKFKNDKAKPFSDSKFLQLLDKAFPSDETADYDDDDEDEDEAPKKKSKSKKVVDEDDDDYSEMSAKELYTLCKKKGLDPEAKKKASYYIDLLESESEDDEWDDEDDDDEWDE